MVRRGAGDLIRHGQLGSGSAVSHSTVPVSVQGLDSGVTAIAAGGDADAKAYACAIQYGVTKCWGNGDFGRLGTGREESSNTPLQATGLSFAPPTQLRAGTVTGYSIAISWSPLFLATGMPAITNYLISWGTDLDDEEGLRTTSVLFPATRYVISGLRAETNYQIAVAGVNRVGIGNRSTLTIQTDQAEPPSAPQELRLGAVTANTLEVRWKPPANNRGSSIESYVVYWTAFGQMREFSKTVDVPTTSTVDVPTTSYVITGLDVKTSYRITVVAANLAGPGVRSIPLVARTLGLAGAQAITVAVFHGCAIYNDAAWCWGDGGFGRTGRRASGGTAPGLVLDLDTGVTAIAAGNNHTCAIQDAAAKCWGFGGLHAVLGNGSQDESITPVQVRGLSDGITAIAAADRHSCAVRRGVAWCWGSNANGELGNGNRQSSSSPVRVEVLGNVVTAIETGNLYSCAIADGAAWCWGDGALGALGNGDQGDNNIHDTPVQVVNLDSSVTVISAGADTACAVQRGVAWCWGRGTSGELGDGREENRSTPVRVQGLSSVTAIAVGEDYSCAVQHGAAWCWGDNRHGQLGNGSAVSHSTVPVSVQGLDSGVTAIAAGGSVGTERYTCAIQYGVAKCWGNGDFGRLGTGREESSNTPLQATGLSFAPPTQLRAGAVTGYSIAISWSSLFLATGMPAITNYLISWGTDLDDEEGLRTTSVLFPATRYVISGLRAETTYQIAVVGVNRVGIGNRSTLTIQTDQAEPPAVPQEVRFGAVTANTIEVRWKPPANNGGSSIESYVVYWTEFGRMREFSKTVDVFTTSYVITGLYVRTSYRITVVATNLVGPGRRSIPFVGRTLELVPMVALQTISVGGGHSCAVYNEAAWCWGDNRRGQLGRGNTNRAAASSPIVVQSLNDGVTAIEAGHLHTCAIQGGAAKCWGLGGNGRLGNGGVDLQDTPVGVSDLDGDVTAISGGTEHTCAIQRGAAWCWGNGASGRLGNNSTGERRNPVAVIGLTSSVTAISAGDEHSCAIHDGAAKCWGLGDEGQLGDSSTASDVIPGLVDGLSRGVTAIAAGGRHSCAIVNATARCWGRGDEGQLGNASVSSTFSPVAVDGLNSGVTAIAAGFLHSCAIVNAAAQCWGWNKRGQLGNGSSDDQSSVAVTVIGLDDGVTDIAAGGFRDAGPLGHSCAIHYGFIKCWGEDNFKQLGNTFRRDPTVPENVEGLSPLAVPSQLRAETVTGYSITVSWSPLVLAADVPAITNYLISWGTDLEDEEGLSTASVSVPTTSYVISGLRAETNYQIAVAGVNRAGIGNRSMLTIQTDQAGSPSAPQELRFDGATTNTIVVSWKSPNIDGGAPVTAYTISWADNTPGSGASTTVSIAASANDNEIYKITGLLSNRFYHIVVTPVNSFGTWSSRLIDYATDCCITTGAADSYGAD